ncbi:MAG: hypothetical protein OEM97_01380 [Acidimicrobiia bacterium]|nr:hypothetical protein [Acidimicrobiia bacterium]
MDPRDAQQPAGPPDPAPVPPAFQDGPGGGSVSEAWRRFAGRSDPAGRSLGNQAVGDEVAEHIPWERLTMDARGQPGWIPYALGVVIVALAATVIWLFRAPPSEPTVITLGPGPIEPELSVTNRQPAGDPVDVAELPVTSEPVAESAQVVSEADLLAFVPVEGDAAARARAEWFVLDYFSNSDASRDAKLADAVRAHVEVPAITSDRASYVDWVRSITVREESDRLIVTVLYRSLVSEAGGPYQTSSVRAVDVPVAVGVDGASAVLDLPTPVSVPARLENGAVPAVWEQAEPAPEVEARGIALLPPDIGAPFIVLAQRNETAWRLVIEGSDQFGVRWPYVVSVPVEPGS